MKRFLILFLSLFTIFSAQARKKLKPAVYSEVIEIYQLNEKLHQSFFSYKGEEIHRVAQEISKKIEGFKESESTRLLGKSKEYLERIRDLGEKKRSPNDRHYHKFSLILIDALKDYELEHYNEYSCPMVKKSWVQNSSKTKKVLNPYAPYMPNCGSQKSHY